MSTENSKIDPEMKKIIEITFITNSLGKTVEAQEILGDGFLVNKQKIDLPEIQQVYSDKVVVHKVITAYEKLKKPVVVEDTSYHLEDLDGLPGALVRWFLDPNNKGPEEEENVGCHRICDMVMIKDKPTRKAWVQSSIAYFDGKNMQIFTGVVKGSIPETPRGEDGFGWDFIFIPEGFNKTFAEMGREEKNKISMRKIALEQLRDYFNKKV